MNNDDVDTDIDNKLSKHSPSSCCIPYPQFEGFLSPFYGSVIKGELILTDDGSTVFVAGVSNHIEIWSPHVKLSFPVDDGGQRSAYKKWPLSVALKCQEKNKSI